MVALRHTISLALALTWPHIRGEWMRYLLTLIGVSLGIAVYGSVRSATRASIDHFVNSSKIFSDESTVTIYSDTGQIDNDAVSAISTLPIVGALTPVSSLSTVTLPSRTRVTLVGTDILTASRTGIDASGEELLEALRHGRGFIGDGVPLVGESVTIALNTTEVRLPIQKRIHEGTHGLLSDPTMILVDISVFARITGRPSHVDRIELLIRPEVSRTEACRAIAAILPPHVRCAPGSSARRLSSSVASSFEISLAFLAGLALFVGALLISSTLHYLLMLRRYESGVLRSIGASRGTLLTLVATEVLSLAGVASLLGIAGSAIVSRHISTQVAQSISTLYFATTVGEVSLSWQVVAECVALGLVATIFAAAIPAREFIYSSPSVLFSSQTLERQNVRFIPGALVTGTFLFVASAVAITPQFLALGRLLGLVAPTLVLAGACCLLLPALVAVIHVLGKLPWTFTSVRLASDHLSATPWRTTLATASILAASGLYLGVSLMVQSFRGAVDTWISHIAKPQVFIAADPGVSSVGVHSISPQLVSSLEQLPCVENMARSAESPLIVHGVPLRVTSVRMSEALSSNRLSFLSALTDEDREGLLSGQPLTLLSESAASRLGATVGDVLWLPRPGNSAPYSVRVVGMLRDYTTDQGVVFVPEEVYRELFGSLKFSTAGLYLHPGCTPEEIREHIANVEPNFTGSLHSASSLRREVLRIFDDTFRITHILQGVCLLIAAATVLNSLAMLLHDKERHMGMLRAIGASRTVITRTICVEALVIGVVGVSGGVVAGMLIAWQLAVPINRVFFGWTVPLSVGPKHIYSLVLSVSVVSVAMGFIIAQRFISKFRTTALRYE